MNNIEIEIVLKKHANVKDAVVLEYNNPEQKKTLTAYIIPRFTQPWEALTNFSSLEYKSSRRSDPRFSYNTSCLMEMAGPHTSNSFNTEVLDISANGIAVKDIPYELDENDQVKLSFPLPGNHSDMYTDAVICYKYTGQLGLKFQHTKEQQIRLQELLLATEMTPSNADSRKRRKAYRFPLQQQCLVSQNKRKSIQAKVRDISGTGISLTGMNSTYHPGEELNITFQLPEDKVEFSGQIVWKKNKDVGIDFHEKTDCPAIIIKKIRDFLFTKLEKEISIYLQYNLPHHPVHCRLLCLRSFPRDRQGIIDITKLIQMEAFHKADILDTTFLKTDEAGLEKDWIDSLTQINKTSFDKSDEINNIPGELVNHFPLFRLIMDSGVQKYYPLSHPQKRIWYSERIYPDTCVGNLFHSCIFPDKVDFMKLETAINLFVKDCDILRIGIWEIDIIPKQFIRPYSPFKVEYYDFTMSDGDVQFKQWIKDQTAIPLIQNKNHLYYFATVTFPDDRDGFLFGIHHIIADETGIVLIIDQIKKIYQQLLNNNIPMRDPLSPNVLSYNTYLQKENEYKKSSKFLTDKEYWLAEFSDYTEPVLLRQFQHLDNIKAKRNEYNLTREFTTEIRRFCSKHKTSIFRFFLAILYIYISRITDKKDITIGTAIHNRFKEEFKAMIGMLVSTTPVRINVKENASSFKKLIMYLNQKINEIKIHQAYPYDLLISDLEKAGIRHPLFDIVLNYHNMDFPLATNWYFHGAINFPLLINISHRGDKNRIKLEIDYNIDLYSAEEIDLFYQHLTNLLTAVLINPEKNIEKLEILSEAEKNKILYEYNDTNIDYPLDKTVHQLFEEQVKRTPDNIAVFYEGKTLTYRELNQKVNQIARILRNIGISPDNCIGILINHSIEMIIGILAVLKAGAAYVPIDPSYPDDRILYSLEDCKAWILLTRKQLKGRVKEFIGVIIELDNDNLYTGDITNLEHKNKPSDLAYVIYTSGTTGKPKGIMVEHKSLVNLSFWSNRIYQVTEHDRATKYACFGFDASVWEIFPYLVAGAALYLFNEEIRYDLELIHQYLCKNKITICFLPTPMCEEYIKLDKTCKSLRLLHTGGDKLQAFKKTNFKICNNYGPAETTVIIAYFILDKLYQNIPIGKPVDNNQIYILSKHNQIQPVGVPGELCISGINLARGYMNNLELSAEKFVNNPIKPGQRMYKTGDLARWLPDGNIEFLGRMDFQIKIRGYRIEIGEIENTIRKYPGIKNVCILVKQYSGGDKRLAAFIQEEKNKPVSLQKLKNEIKKVLPDYMVPALYARLDHFPYTQNGKIDRRALDKIKVKPVEDENMTEAQTETEIQIMNIWKEILKIDKIGTNTNFYEIGGNSLKLIELSNRLQLMFNIKIPVVKLFKHYTIKKQALYITGMDHENKKIIRLLDHQDNKISTSDIAIIGMAGRFPGAGDIHQFWENLINGREAVTFFSDQELLEAGIDPDLIKRPDYIKAKAVLDDPESFDADFFGYSRNDAWFMDPQIRIFHEVIYQALENAGYVPNRYCGKIGLFAGASPNFFWQQITLAGKNSFADQFPYMILNKDFLSTRIAYKLNLKGPAFTLQTACSTSLSAVNMAVHSLLGQDCHIALAGGVSLSLPKKSGYLYKEGFTFSPDGRCKAFDAEAKGIIRGEGVGVVVLKPLAKALEDNDHIWAVIKGSAANNDGKEKIGFTAPSITGQAEVIKTAIKRAGIPPETITYIEAHGTGTILGDPVEIEGLKTAFNTTRKQFCRIGSVKTNIGHLDAAAGIAGLIKTALSLYYKKIPPSLHYKSPNPKINFANSPFIVNSSLTQWQRVNEIPLRAGISSFGIGGTNAHVILEEAPAGQEIRSQVSLKDQYRLLLLSAKTKSSLEQMTRNLAVFLQDHQDIDLDDVACTLQTRREIFEYRRMVVCRNITEAVKLLSDHTPATRIYTFEIDQNKVVKKNSTSRLIKEIKENNMTDPVKVYKLGQYWCEGYSVNWEEFYRKRKQIPLPGYAFKKDIFSIEEISKIYTNQQNKKITESEKKKDINQWFYLPQWISSIPPQKTTEIKLTFLIFLDNFGIGKRLAKVLRKNNHNVISVTRDDGYNKNSKYSYAINPYDKETYQVLFSDIFNDNLQIDRIVHLFALCANYHISEKNIERAMHNGFNSLLNITRNINRYYKDNNILIYSMTNNLFAIHDNRKFNPVISTIMGAVKTIPQEYKTINCLNIDIILSASTISDPDFISQLEMEVLSTSIFEQVVAYRSHCRWVLEYQPVTRVPVQAKKGMIRNNGVYLITGGLGGIGFTFAEELVKKYHAKLIIISGRTALPLKKDWDKLLSEKKENNSTIQKIKCLKKLQQYGSYIYVDHADITDELQLNRIIQKGLKKFKTINGIIHTAGVADGKRIQFRDNNENRKVMTVKIAGTLLIEKLCHHLKPDFFLLCSSLASINGGIGQAGYCAANSFLDAYAHSQQQKNKIHIISINWDTWQELGMAVNLQKQLARLITEEEVSEEEKQLIKTYLNHSILPQEGINIFYHALEMKHPQIVISTIAINSSISKRMYSELFTLAQKIYPKNSEKENSLPTDKIFTIKEINDELINIWQKYLGIGNIKLEDNFFNLGGSSLLAIQIAPEINRLFNVNLSINSFMEVQTINQLGKFIHATRYPHLLQKEKIKKRIPHLIPLKKCNTINQPLFLIHPVAGTVYFYHNLINSLSGNYSIYGIEAPGINGRIIPLTSIKTMAAEYIKIMKQLQVKGPYRIGGSSLGGCIAYEMALQLQLNKEMVNPLIMIDTPGPGSKLPQFKEDNEILAYFLSYNDYDYSKTLNFLKTLPDMEKLKYFLSKNSLYQQTLFSKQSIEKLKQSIKITGINSKAMDNYFSSLSRYYNGHTLFFSATEPSQIPVNLEKDWKNFLTGEVKVFKIPGNHISINLFPHVKKIAKWIDQNLLHT